VFAAWRWNQFDVSVTTLIAYSKWFVTLSIYWLLFGSVLDIFNPIRAASTRHIMLNVAITVILTVLVYVATPWFTPKIVARNYIFGLLTLSMALLVAWRGFYARWMARSAFHRRALLLGPWQYSGEMVLDIRNKSRDPAANPFRGSGYNLLGYVAESKQGENYNDIFPWLGNPASLPRISRSLSVDEVIVAKEQGRLFDPALHDVLLDCRELGIKVSPLSEVYENLTQRYPVSYAQLDPALLLSGQDSPAFRLYDFAKRFMDIVLAMAGIVALMALIPVVALMNEIGSPGPLLFRQLRIGKGGKPFVMYKFRSMIPRAEQETGVVWSDDQDPRITPIGRWLRRTRLDELPQVFNVLRGKMSIVGPRPERPEFVGRLMRELPVYRARHFVKPGITGWAQVRFRYGNSVEDARIKLEYDLYYIKHRSLFLDFLIILKTIPAMVLMQGH